MKSKVEAKVAGLSARDLPPALRVFWETAPANFRVPSILTALVCYCALATRLRVKYKFDIDPHALLLQVIILGKPSEGKSFTRPIVKQLMQPLLLRDKELRRQEQAYAELKKTAAKNKQLPEEPITDVRCLQNVTRVKLVKRADMFIRKYGEPLTFMLFSEELATMTEGNRKAYSDLRTIGRLAYDLGAEFSNDTNSDASYCAMVDIIWCSLFCSTPAALDKYMDNTSIEGGNVTRHVVASLDNLMGSDAPAFRRMTSAENQMLQGVVDNLMAETYNTDGTLQPTHLVDMSWMDREIDKWCNVQRDRVLRTGSMAVDCFYKRSSVSAFRMATLCYHLWGEDPKYQKQVARFYRFIASFILEGLLSHWGRKYESMHKNDGSEGGGTQPQLYDTLPKQFSRDQLREMIVKCDLSTPARVFLCMWKKKKWIHQPNPEQDVYIKNY